MALLRRLSRLGCDVSGRSVVSGELVKRWASSSVELVTMYVACRQDCVLGVLDAVCWVVRVVSPFQDVIAPRTDLSRKIEAAFG